MVGKEDLFPISLLGFGTFSERLLLNFRGYVYIKNVIYMYINIKFKK